MQKREEKFRQMKKEDKNGGIKDRRKEKKLLRNQQLLRTQEEFD